MERDRGSVMLWMVVVLVLATLVATLVMREGTVATDDGRAQAVADLTALAGADGGQGQAQDVAQRNGAALVDFDVRNGVTGVVVRRDGVTASAHARPGGNPMGATGP